jgi:hypothetical protein
MLTDTQLRAVDLLGTAYNEDRPAHVGSRTAKTAEAITVSQRVARRLIELGVARYTRPQGRFLLLTDLGKQIANRDRVPVA